MNETQETRSVQLQRRIEVLKERERMIHAQLSSLGKWEADLREHLQETIAESNALDKELQKLVAYE